MGSQDNYAWLLLEQSGKVAVVDPSEAAPVMAALESRCCPPPSPVWLWSEVQVVVKLMCLPQLYLGMLLGLRVQLFIFPVCVEQRCTPANAGT